MRKAQSISGSRRIVAFGIDIALSPASRRWIDYFGEYKASHVERIIAQSGIALFKRRDLQR